jgi:hypothetical protein
MVSKYQPLTFYFRSLPHETNDISITFAKIEDILKFTLPDAAHQYQAWWNWEANPKHPQKVAWQNAGWKVEYVDLLQNIVRFQRIELIASKVFPLPSPVQPTLEPTREIKLASLEIESSLSLFISHPIWKPVFMIPRNTTLQKGRHGLYHNIIEKAAHIEDRFGCYSWGSSSEIFYIGSFSKDRKNKRFHSNFHGRIHNYLQNHRLKENGRKNTNLMVFENLNSILKTQEIFLRIFTCDLVSFGYHEWTMAQFSEDAELVLSCERLLISWYKMLKQCQWNRK